MKWRCSQCCLPACGRLAAPSPWRPPSTAPRARLVKSTIPAWAARGPVPTTAVACRGQRGRACSSYTAQRRCLPETSSPQLQLLASPSGVGMVLGALLPGLNAVCFPVSKSLVFPARDAPEQQQTHRHSRLDLEGRRSSSRQGPAAAAVRRTGRRGLPRESRRAAPPDGRATQLWAAGCGAAARARRAGAVSCDVSCAAPGLRARGRGAAHARYLRRKCQIKLARWSVYQVIV
jgi:hypothetical protein